MYEQCVPAGETQSISEAIRRVVAAKEAATAPAVEVLPAAERCLTEVDNLNRYRSPDGSHSQAVLADMLVNYTAATEEGGMPSAVSEAYHEYIEDHEDSEGRRRATFVWLGQTALQVAQSGRKYYRHAESQARGYVEEEEAIHGEQDKQPGVVSFLVSAKMSAADGPKEVAEAENLAEQDAVRASWLDIDKEGNIRGRRLQSVLVSDIPLEAWVDWLADPANPFGKSIEVSDATSALAVMKTFRELKLPREALPDPDQPLLGALKTIVPYIKDPELRQRVKTQLVDFYVDQAGKRAKAANIARRWRDFDVALADSLHKGVAEPSIEAFVYQLQDRWGEDDLALIRAAQINGTQRLSMSRGLAVRIEEAQRKLFFDAASVVSDNRAVLKQLDSQILATIRQNELRVQQLYDRGHYHEIARVQAANNRLIAQQNLVNGGGCPGKSTMRFAEGDDLPDLLQTLNEQSQEASRERTMANSMDRKTWKRKKGKCVVDACPTRPAAVEVGPCGVCMDRCQEIYDSGGDPTNGMVDKIIIKESETPRVQSSESMLSLSTWRLFASVGALASSEAGEKLDKHKPVLVS